MHIHIQSTVEAVNVKQYRQIPAKQLCTRNEFSQYSVWQNGKTDKTTSQSVELLDTSQHQMHSASVQLLELALS